MTDQSTSEGEWPIKTSVEWWAYWQKNEQAITELYLKLTPGISFSAAAPVVVVIGHNRNKAMAIAALNTLKGKMDGLDLPMDQGIKAVTHLIQHQSAIEGQKE